ncbi:hypothetical protein [Candidatus Poriferisocius sp.]|uniref:hypothetical protein n=1 Tax=Candidatus Poriferisocius sp. TaxID=3101276 RepID=UPI003B0265AB
MAVWWRIAVLAATATLLATGGATAFSSTEESLAQVDTYAMASHSEVLTASDGFIGDGFGIAVDVDGDVMVVGAFGAAYVFSRSDGQWVETAKLSVLSAPPDRETFRRVDDSSGYQKVAGQEVLIDDSDNVFGGFGRSVALDGGVIVVGAYEAAYIYTSVEGEWVGTAKLVGTDDLSGLGVSTDGSRTIARWSSSGFLSGGFGHSVAVDGDVIVVGANGAVGHGEFETGFPRSTAEYVESVHVFARSNGKWQLTAKMINPGGEQLRSVVQDVAANGDVIAVGSHEAVYVYESSSDGWVDSATLVPSDHSFSPGFGAALSVGEDAIAVASTSGVHVFERLGREWREQLLVSGSSSGYGQFGWDVAVEGKLIVAAPLQEQFGPATSPIAFEMFDRPSEGWRFTYKAALDGSDWKPQAIALDGEVLVVGAHMSSYQREADGVTRFRHHDPGAVYVFDVELLPPVGNGDAATPTPAVTPTAAPTVTAVPTLTATPTPAVTPTAAPTVTAVATPTPTPTEAVAASPVLVDDNDSSDGGTDAAWVGVFIALLALLVLAVALFVILRKPDDDAGRYNT